jgi:phosphatidate cytidylyltransferase
MRSELLVRFYTAIPLVVSTLTAVFYLNARTFLLLDILLIVLAAWEWSGLCGYADKRMRYGYLCFVGAGCVLVQYANIDGVAKCTLLLSSGLMAYMGLLVGRQKLFACSALKLATVGAIYLWFACYALSYLKTYPPLLGLGLLLIILTDSFAYFVGRLFGKRPLAPLISPNKTWEGFLGGLIGPAVVFMMILILNNDSAYLKGLYLLLGMMTSLVAQAGDLFESAVKRQRNVKDSGHWLPGHGGLLDRLDSIVSALPFFAAGVYFITQYVS